MENSVDVNTLVRWFEDYEDATTSARRESELDRDYYDNKQWSSAEAAELKKRGQPMIWINRIKRKIELLNGIERTTRTDPSAYPRTPADEEAAQAATDSLRYISDENDFPQIKSAVWDNMLVEGCGGVEVTVEQQPDGQWSVKLFHINWDRLFYDPHSRKYDFTDAKYKGYAIWMDMEDAKERFPAKAAELDTAISSNAQSTTFSDRPRTVWISGDRKRILLVQCFYEKGGKWYQVIFTKGCIVDGSHESPFVDEYGRSVCQLELISAYVDRDNNRYGMVREMRPVQDEINKRRSKSLHLLSMRQVVADQGAVLDIDEAKKQLAKPDGYIEKTPGADFTIQPTSDMAAAQFQLLQESKSEIDLMGPNAAMAGKDDRSQSGRAIMAQQQGGYVELQPLLDRLRHWQRRVYQQCWMRVKQYWTAEKWIRVTDDENSPRFVGLNQPVTVAQIMQQLHEEGKPVPQQYMMMPPDAIAGIRNPVAELNVDIIIDEMPDTVSMQSEQFEQLVKLAQGGVPFPPDVLIEASTLRNKDKLLEKLKPDPAAEEAKAAEMQTAKDMAMRKASAETGKTESEAALKQAQALEIAQRMQQPPVIQGVMA